MLQIKLFITWNNIVVGFVAGTVEPKNPKGFYYTLPFFPMSVYPVYKIFKKKQLADQIELKCLLC